jgi:hypothetical protein
VERPGRWSSPSEFGEKKTIATTQLIAAAFTDWSAQVKIAIFSRPRPHP